MKESDWIAVVSEAIVLGTFVVGIYSIWTSSSLEDQKIIGISALGLLSVIGSIFVYTTWWIIKNR